jgi:hypothetical protein
LKQAGATTIIFTGDPLFPKYLTSEMTKENYFPEWAMSGTVLADTAVFGRTFDQQQWKHAFGLDLTPVRIPKDKEDAYTLHQWWYGTQPPTQNNYQIVKGDWELLFDGLQAAGPNLTPQSFQNGMFAIPTSAPTNRPTQRTIATYGSHGYWPGVDPLGLDNAGILYWDPTAAGQDETGTQGVGMYRLLDGGVRYLPNRWPTTPVKLFDPAGTVTVYGETNVPADLLPATQPVPANAPAHK